VHRVRDVRDRSEGVTGNVRLGVGCRKTNTIKIFHDRDSVEGGKEDDAEGRRASVLEADDVEGLRLSGRDQTVATSHVREAVRRLARQGPYGHGTYVRSTVPPLYYAIHEDHETGKSSRVPHQK
jgi:hypothetical protein